MSKKKRRNQNKLASRKVYLPAEDLKQTTVSGRFVHLKTHWWIIAIIVFLSIGALGAGLKYLDEDAKRELARRDRSNTSEEPSFLSKVNPFLSAPLPNTTPQLSKEYIYAGEKLLAVEDANANAAPPSDLAIWRPSSGTWWMLNGQSSQYYALAWGMNGDKPLPGDYDGDGESDFCIFRASTNEWWIVKSSDYSSYAVAFGQSGDVPAPADYDGDGKTDVGVFRAGAWWIYQSSNGVTISPTFGQSGDLPAPKDFDGDGKADLAFFRNSNKTFYSHNSNNNTFQYVTFSFTGDLAAEKLVPGDYDGDGRADYGIRHGNNWLIRQSSNNQTVTIPWESGDDKAVQNDYDGDGKVDVAVWRASDGKWRIRQSSHVGQSNELREVQWGISGDVPVPAYYRW